MAAPRAHKQDGRSERPTRPSIIEFRGVSKRYSNADLGLDQATFGIDRGDFVFLVGSTGSGKSTVMRLLIKELDPTEGTIRVAGHDLSGVSRKRIPFYRRNIGVVFQDFKLLPSRTVYENVAYALQVTGGTRREIRDKVPDILRLTGLSTKLHNYPDQLSGGEQQRVSIARAFVNHPPLLLADEPTGNLDPETSIDIMRLLYRINRTGTTVLVATHDQAMVDKMRRRVLELSRGRIVRDEATGLYARDETTREFAQRMRQPPTRPPGIDVEPAFDEERLSVRITFFVREATRAMRRNAAPTFAALATVLVTTLVVGVFIPAVEVTNDAANTVRSRLIVDVYMRNTATSSDDARVRRELIAIPHVKSLQFESKAQAYAQQSKQNPAAYQLLGTNPLPDTYHVFPDNPSNVLAIRAALTRNGGVIDPSIQTVSNKKGYTKRALELTSAVKWGGLAFALLLTIASILLIANTIRLSLYARRREVEVMKLVGATDWFIRWPFVIEGLIVGAAGGVLAIVVLGLAKVALLDPLFSGWSLVSQIRTIAFPALIAVMLTASMAVSALGSGISLRRFLRV